MGGCHCSSGKEGLPQPLQTVSDNTLLSQRLPDAKKAHADVLAAPAVVAQQEEGQADATVEQAASPKRDVEANLPESRGGPIDVDVGSTKEASPVVAEAAGIESAVEEDAQEAAMESPKPDFSGEWKMVRYEGDFETWLKEAGVGWASRKVASAAGFGVNGTFASIQQTQTQITINSKSIKGTTLQELKIGGDDQDDADVVSSKPIKVAVRWEEFDGRAILVVEASEAKNKAGSVSVPLTRRYLDGDSMIAERTNSSGTVVRLFFAREG